MVLCCCLHLHWPPQNCTLFHLVARHSAGICRMLKSAADITHGQSQLDHELVDFLLTKCHTGPSWLCRYSDFLPCSPSDTGLECLFCGLCYGSLWHQPCQHYGSPFGAQWSTSFCINQWRAHCIIWIPIRLRGSKERLRMPSAPFWQRDTLWSGFLPQSWRSSGTSPIYFQLSSYSVQ